MPLYEYECNAGHLTEAVRPLLTASVICPHCGSTAARRAVSRVAVRVGAENDWTSSVRDNGQIRVPVAERKVHTRLYDEASQQLEYQHAQAEESAQRTLPEPPLARAALRLAKRLQHDGIKDSLDVGL